MSATSTVPEVHNANSCQIGTRRFDWGRRTYVMGIVNVTSDSFSGDGLLRNGDEQRDSASSTVERAAAQAMRMLAAGADIIDIGGESTRPGAEPVDSETEIGRVVPLVKHLRTITDAPISIDTSKAEVARRALDVGANLVNDIWGLELDPDLGPLVASAQVPVVIMHNRSKPRHAEVQERLGGRYVGVEYDDLMSDIVRDLQRLVTGALDAGIRRDHIIIDPGIGFGKTVGQNLALLNRSDRLRVLGLPILLGPSRKSFIGYTLDLPADQRLEGTLAAVAVAIVRGGVDIVRVHDVRAAVRTARMTDAILRAT